jgi:hypothetical protein
MDMCVSEKPAAAPAAKKAAVDGKLFFVSEPQSIRVVESECPITCRVLWVQFHEHPLSKIDFLKHLFSPLLRNHCHVYCKSWR